MVGEVVATRSWPTCNDVGRVEAVRMQENVCGRPTHSPEWDAISSELRGMGYTMLADAMDNATSGEERGVAAIVLMNVRQIIAQHGESVALEPMHARIVRLIGSL